MAKFRSWNKWNQKFEYFKDGMYFRDEKCKDYYDSHEVNNFNWKNAEQSTGNYDKNGVEIFENDIVVVDKYTSENFTYTMKKHEWNWLAEQKGCNGSGIGSGYWGKGLIVIGNTHEGEK